MVSRNKNAQEMWESDIRTVSKKKSGAAKMD